MTRLSVVLLFHFVLTTTSAFVRSTPWWGASRVSLKKQQQHLSSSTRSNDGPPFVAMDDDDITEMEQFLKRCKELCQQRNLPLEKVKNARDLASANNSPIIPGRLFRTGRLGDATENDRNVLFRQRQIKTLVDLRSPTELKDDPALLREEVFEGFTNLVWKERGRGKAGCLKELLPNEFPVKSKRFWKNKKPSAASNNNKDNHVNDIEGDHMHDDDDDELCTLDCDEEEDAVLSADEYLKYPGKQRYFVSLMNEFKYVRGTVTKLRKRDIAKSVLKSPGALVSKRAWNSLKKPFLNEINDGGLPMLNELLLRFGAPGIRFVLELCADRNRHPIAFYCTAGKDRTGMIAAIILSLVGVEAEDIVEDYTLSANVYAEMDDHQAMVGALSQRSLNPKIFLGAPAYVMKDTLEAIEENYGSVEGYCNWIGFGPEMQDKLRDAILKD